MSKTYTKRELIDFAKNMVSALEEGIETMESGLPESATLSAGVYCDKLATLVQMSAFHRKTDPTMAMNALARATAQASMVIMGTGVESTIAQIVETVLENVELCENRRRVLEGKAARSLGGLFVSEGGDA